MQLAEAGLLSEIHLTNLTSENGGDNGWTKKRFITAQNLAQGLCSDFCADAPCALEFSWPMRWLLVGEEEVDKALLDIRAIPALGSEAGGIEAGSESFLPEWSVLTQTNLDFFDLNNFEYWALESSSITGPSKFVAHQHHQRKFSSDLLRRSLACQADCSIMQALSSSSLSLSWGEECGIQGLMKINGTGAVNYNASHILYSLGCPAKAALASNASIEAQFSRFKSLFRGAGGSALVVAKGSDLEAEALNSNAYEPFLEASATMLTRLLAVVARLAEWIASGPCWAFCTCRLLFSRIFRKLKREGENHSAMTEREARVFKISKAYGSGAF